jgi:hypothetical protein
MSNKPKFIGSSTCPIATNIVLSNIMESAQQSPYHSHDCRSFSHRMHTTLKCINCACKASTSLTNPCHPRACMHEDLFFESACNMFPSIFLIYENHLSFEIATSLSYWLVDLTTVYSSSNLAFES